VSLTFAGGRASVALWAALLAPTWLVAAKLLGLYDRDQRSLRHLTVDELPRILTWALVGTTGLSLALTIIGTQNLSAGEAVRVGIVAAGSGLLLRAAGRIAWRKLTPPERAIVVGDGVLAAAAKRKLELFPDIHAEIVAELPQLTVADLRRTPTGLPDADRILLAASHLDEELVAELVVYCRHRQVKLSVVPPLRGMFGSAVELSHVADLPVLQYSTWDVSRSTMFLKRIVDVVVSAALLVVLAPVLVLVAALIALGDGRPVLFVQTRVGQGGRPFRMRKLRTMVRDAEAMLPGIVALDRLDEPVFKLRHDPRVTRLGHVLRRTSIDEMPQLLNVLRGEMSLVGPRPEQIELVERYSDEQRSVRLAVKPGMTGPMQVYGRGQLTLDERLAVERDYVENVSLGRDLHILALTVGSVVHGRGAF